MTYISSSCSTASITGNSHSGITTTQKVSATGSVGIWYDNVSGTASAPKKCGDFTVTVTKTTVPTGYVEATMGADFSWTESPPQSILTVNPQNLLVGDYVLQFKICLTLFPA